MLRLTGRLLQRSDFDTIKLDADVENGITRHDRRPDDRNQSGRILNGEQEVLVTTNEELGIDQISRILAGRPRVGVRPARDVVTLASSGKDPGDAVGSGCVLERTRKLEPLLAADDHAQHAASEQTVHNIGVEGGGICASPCAIVLRGDEIPAAHRLDNERVVQMTGPLNIGQLAVGRADGLAEERELRLASGRIGDE